MMDSELRQALDEQLADALADDDVRAIVLAGGPQAFSGGGDIGSMEGLDVDAARARMRAGHGLVRRLAGADKPVVGAVAGWAVGAAVGLLLLCDHLVGSRSSRLAFPFFRLALVPDWGISATLPGRVGSGRARQLLFSGRAIGASEAVAIGLLDEMVSDAELDQAAVASAVELAKLPRQAVALTKGMLSQSLRLDSVLALEGAAQALCLVSGDAAEGRAAFADKREPRF
jgi:2-(1,2-epoxy-1,2-dihydrophenyl)acetyl-CoA isomerase